jgi:Uma2 family endonuclease
MPLHIDVRTEPEPDLLLLRPRDDDYIDAHPTAADVLLLIEVADSSLYYDQTAKLPLYAEFGVPEVWLLNLPARQMEIYQQPQGGAYQVHRVAEPVEILAPQLLPEATLAMSEVWR